MDFASVSSEGGMARYSNCSSAPGPFARKYGSSRARSWRSASAGTTSRSGTHISARTRTQPRVRASGTTTVPAAIWPNTPPLGELRATDVRTTRMAPSGTDSMTAGESTEGSGAACCVAGRGVAAAGLAGVLTTGTACLGVGLTVGAAFAAEALNAEPRGSEVEFTQPPRDTLTHVPCLDMVCNPAPGLTSPRIAPLIEGAERSRMAIGPMSCAGNESLAPPSLEPSTQPVKVTN